MVVVSSCVLTKGNKHASIKIIFHYLAPLKSHAGGREIHVWCFVRGAQIISKYELGCAVLPGSSYGNWCCRGIADICDHVGADDVDSKSRPTGLFVFVQVHENVLTFCGLPWQNVLRV